MDVTICDERGDAGFSWCVDESMQRTSHALASQGRVWLVDPVGDPAMLDRAGMLGSPAGVIQLLDRHNRDCAAIADRLAVPLHVCPDAVAGSPFSFVRLTWWPWWREVALWWEAAGLLAVAEAVGTNPFFTVGRGPVGVHPLLRLFPPRRLLPFAPRHLLTGHGPGVEGDDATDGLRRAIADARRGLPALLRALPSLRHRT